VFLYIKKNSNTIAPLRMVKCCRTREKKLPGWILLPIQGLSSATAPTGWKNVIVRNNTVYHAHGGFVIGSEM